MLKDITRKWSAFGFLSENSKEKRAFLPLSKYSLRASFLWNRRTEEINAGRHSLKEQNCVKLQINLQSIEKKQKLLVILEIPIHLGTFLK